MNQLFLLCAFVPLFYRLANALPTGAPAGTCITMMPSVGKHGPAQDTMAPYVIQVDKTYYSENGTVKVYIKVCGNTVIGGFLIEAREEGKAIPLGNFSKIPQKTKHLNCTSSNAETALAAVTHSEVLGENNMLSFEWKPSTMTTGKIYFVATIAKDRPTYWLGVKSVVLQKMTPGMKHAKLDNPKCPGGNGAIFTVNIVLLVLAMSANLFI
ncbi:Hypothetical predicted protein [Paramuricea clavata]|uniref:Uncharacterized protein n=1 Tax=Paramuricea clavata TaxID=317549 RepID=A0A6S7GD53_PARCT|nr:Hypothetical predicted protein [Paramuricea clavata]